MEKDEKKWKIRKYKIIHNDEYGFILERKMMEASLKFTVMQIQNLSILREFISCLPH